MDTFGNSRIAGIGAYLPTDRVTSDELMAEVRCRRFGIPEDYISRRIGIIERRLASANQHPSDLATLASEFALRDAGVKADELDFIIYTGITRDCEEPSTAHFVQTRLGASRAVCFDVSNACLGFLTGLSLANSYIANYAANNVLVCCGEIQSGTMNDFMGVLKTTNDKGVFKSHLGVLTVGDAGGAMVIQPASNQVEGWKWMRFLSNGSHARLCYFKRNSSGVEGAMLMKEISKEIVSMHAQQMRDTYDHLDWPPNSVSKLYCHQVGKKPHDLLTRVAQVSATNSPITYNYFGNLTTATFPVNMSLNKPNRGDRLLLLGTGSGLTICQGGMIF